MPEKRSNPIDVNLDRILMYPVKIFSLFCMIHSLPNSVPTLVKSAWYFSTYKQIFSNEDHASRIHLDAEHMCINNLISEGFPPGKTLLSPETHFTMF